MLGLMGIAEVDFVYAEGLATGDQRRQAIDGLVARL